MKASFREKLIVQLLSVIIICHYVEANCPSGFVLQNGICSQQLGISCPMSLQCPQSIQCIAGSCNQQTSCDENLILFQGNCLNLNLAQCPLNTVLKNGYCLPLAINVTSPNPCPFGSHFEGDSCVLDEDIQCPTNYDYVNGTCVHDGSCPNGSFLYNGICWNPCPSGAEFSNGTCIITIKSSAEPSIMPPAHIIYNYTNIINVTNIINNTYIYNIDTRSNQTNLNNLNLNSTAHSENKTQKKKSHCCHITEPKKCEKVNDKYRCYHRRRQVCGDQCIGNIKFDYDEEVENYRPEVPIQSPSLISPPEILFQRPPMAQRLIIQQPHVIQQPVILQQPHVVQQPVMLQQPHVVQQPVILQQPHVVQQPVMLQQPHVVQQPVILQQPHVVRQPVIVQKPQIIAQPVVIQQPQVVAQHIMVQQPQVVAQPVMVQQPQVVRQSIVAQQHQLINQPAVHLSIAHQQPQIIRQPVIVQQKSQIGQFVSGSTSSCIYQNTWPFVKCGTQAHMDCSLCQTRRCQIICYNGK